MSRLQVAGYKLQDTVTGTYYRWLDNSSTYFFKILINPIRVMKESQKSVLIIDDDSRNIFALKATLVSIGYTCYTALTAQEGIDILLNNKGIKIVLMDMMMPEMDGYEAINIIRNNEKISFLPIIAVTAQAMVGDREKCLKAGADDYVSKPINVDELLGKLNNY